MNTVDSTIPYASPADRPVGPRVWAAALIALAGLTLLVIGGCFLIGVMLITSGGVGMIAGGLTRSQQHLVYLLYLLALGAFGGGIWVIVLGLRALLKVVRA